MFLKKKKKMKKIVAWNAVTHCEIFFEVCFGSIQYEMINITPSICVSSFSLPLSLTEYF